MATNVKLAQDKPDRTVGAAEPTLGLPRAAEMTGDVNNDPGTRSRRRTGDRTSSSSNGIRHRGRPGPRDPMKHRETPPAAAAVQAGKKKMRSRKCRLQAAMHRRPCPVSPLPSSLGPHNPQHKPNSA